jgi:hypothetical protein
MMSFGNLSLKLNWCNKCWGSDVFGNNVNKVGVAVGRLLGLEEGADGFDDGIDDGLEVGYELGLLVL